MSKKRARDEGREEREMRAKHPARTKVNKELLDRFAPKTEGQLEYVKLMESHPITLVIGPAGTGKAQPLDSKVLTPSGWKLMGDIVVGDKVTTPKGKMSTVTGVFPQGKKQIHQITFHDGSSARCCDEHLWKCFTRKYWEGSTLQILSLEEIRHLIEEGMVVSIPLTEPVGAAEDANLPIDPYLLGLLLGDGHLPNASFSTKDDFIIEQMAQTLRSDYKTVKNSSGCDYMIVCKNSSVHKNTEKGKFNNYYKQTLAELGLKECRSNSKFIPDVYKNASVAQKWAMVQGLMDTDGTVSPHKRGTGGGTSFTTVSKQLADDLQQMLWSLGATCTITNRRPTFTYKGQKKQGQVAYTLFIGCSTPKKLFRLPRKQDLCLEKYGNGRIQLQRRVSSIVPVSIEEAQCIMIDDSDHLYITDDYVVTHNTFLAVVSAIRALIEGKYSKIVLTRPAIEAAGEKLGALPGNEQEKIFPYLRPLYDSLEKILGKIETERLVNMGVIEIIPMAYMRGLSLENSTVIVDESQNASVEQFKMLLTRLGKYSKLVATGDLEQSDIDRNSKRSGLEDAVLRFAEENEIAIAHLGMADIQRHALVCRIIKGYKVKLPNDVRYESLYKDE